MEYLILPLAAVVVSGLTLLTGFGLGTLQLPFFALFFPLDMAVAMTAVVHFLNNMFKLILLGKHAHRRTILLFGLPAIVSALIGAGLLVWMSEFRPLVAYSLGQRVCEITAIKITIAALMVVFITVEFLPRFKDLAYDPQYLPLGGIISGFFGGLSGHQGAFRAAFLMRAGLGKKEFIATGIVIACCVDLTRLSVYISHFKSTGINQHPTLLVITTLAAFLGSFLGNLLLKKMTWHTVQWFVSALIVVIAVALSIGLV